MVEDITGKRFKSKSGGWFTVLRKSDKKQGRAFLYEVEFDKYNGVKYKTLSIKSNINIGRIKNPFYSTVCGVGYWGNIKLSENNRQIHKRWAAMINRCYNSNYAVYHHYGGNGVTVCERWLCFENFYHDFVLLDGYDENNLKNLQLDKDVRAKTLNGKIYSPETCCLILKENNLGEMNKRVKQRKIKAISPNGETFISDNQNEFARQHYLSQSSIWFVLNNKQESHKGWKFEYC